MKVKGNIFLLFLHNMRKIRNIHLSDDPDQYQCFGCSPHNNFGLQLEFWEDGDELVSYWDPRPILQSYPNVIHGGIQATLMDEIAGWVVYVKCGTVGLTVEMNVKFKQPLCIDLGQITIRGRLALCTKRIATIYAQLIDSSGKICAESELKFFLLSETDAREKYHYPGVEAFYET